MPGVNLAGLSTIATGNLTVSSINGGAVPAAPQLTVAVSPANALVYAPPGGGNSGGILNIAATANHSYRIEFPVKIQGWNSSNGLSNTYAPAIGDSLYISFDAPQNSFVFAAQYANEHFNLQGTNWYNGVCDVTYDNKTYKVQCDGCVSASDAKLVIRKSQAGAAGNAAAGKVLAGRKLN
jgi:hypothetical protein